MSDQTEKRLAWLSFVHDSALKHGVFRPADVIVHATPDLLALHLPKELQIRTLDVAFEGGKMTPEVILGVNPPSTLVKHIPSHVLWAVVREAATRHGIAQSGNTPKQGRTPIRNWIAEVISFGLAKDIFNPADVTRHIPPAEWVRDVPLEVVAKMISAGLTRPQFDPRLALEHLTPNVIGEFVNPVLAWAILDEGAVRAFDLKDNAKDKGNAARTSGTFATMPAATPPSATSGSFATMPAAAPPAPPIPAPTPAVEKPAAGDWDTGMVESVDAWVESADVVLAK